MSKASDFFAGGGGPEIGSITLTAQKVTENGLSLLPCDGATYVAADYPLLAYKLNDLYATGLVTYTKGVAVPIEVSNITWKTDLSIAWGIVFNSDGNLENDLFTSTDGVTWTFVRNLVRQGGAGQGRMSVFDISELDGTIIAQNGVYPNLNPAISRDFGLTWTPLNIVGTGYNADWYVADACIYRDGLKMCIFMEGLNPAGQQTVAFSGDGGLTWNNATRTDTQAGWSGGRKPEFNTDGSAVYNCSSQASQGVYRFTFTAGTSTVGNLPQATYGDANSAPCVRNHATGEMYLVTNAGIWTNPSPSQPITGWVQVAPNTATYGLSGFDDKYMLVNTEGSMAIVVQGGLLTRKSNGSWLRGYGESFANQPLRKIACLPNPTVFAFTANDGTLFEYLDTSNTTGVVEQFLVPEIVTPDVGHTLQFTKGPLYKIVGDAK